MIEESFSIEGVYIGKPEVFATITTNQGTTKELLSSINKIKIEKSIKITKTGFIGERQATKNHGGIERAILQYDPSNYKKIATLFPEIPPEKLEPPGFGENISAVGGMNEKTVCIGDIYRMGTAVVQVTQPRKPCYKLNHWFQEENFAKIIEKNCVTGWLYQVLQEGEVKIGDQIVLISRPYPRLTVHHILGLYSSTTLTKKDLSDMLLCDVLPLAWKSTIETRIATSKVPCERGRLFGSTNTKFVKY